jgi:putative ABC transport system substrate-binding protein
LLKIKKIFFLCIALLALLAGFFVAFQSPDAGFPVVAIANYGPHSSLQSCIKGIKDELVYQGFEENKQVHFEIIDVNFESFLINQMLAKLKTSNPRVLVVMTTPVAQTAKNMIKNIPLVFSAVTDPVQAGLIAAPNKAAVKNITGVSERQDLRALLNFARLLFPDAKKIGMLYAVGEANDMALLKMMQAAAAEFGMKILVVPVEQARDVPLHMWAFKNKVDFIYVGASGPIQPSLPAIVSAAEAMKIPVFNVSSEEVMAHRVFASFGVSYYKIGRKTGAAVAQILNGAAPEDLVPIYPDAEDHEAFISKRRSKAIGFVLPEDLNDVVVVE